MIIEPGHDAVELARVEAEWYRGEQKLAYEPVTDFLYAVTGAKGVLVPDGNVDPGSGRALLRVELADDEERQEELTLREVSKVVKLHESRVSQLKSQAILRLRSYIRKRWPNNGPS